MRRCSRLATVLVLVGWWGLGPWAGGEALQAESSSGLELVEALRQALENDPNVALEATRVELSKAALDSARSPFDPVLSSALTVSEDRAAELEGGGSASSTVTSSLGLIQLLRSGLRLEPGVELVQTDDNRPSSTPTTSARVTFRVRQPLLAGRGRGATTAGERSGQRDLAASLLEQRHAVAARLRAVAAQYWITAAAHHDLEVLRESERGSRQLLDNTRKLIEADQVPAAELVQLEANLASKESATLGGERALFTARQDLGREIGLEAESIRQLPIPADGFPELDPTTVPTPEEAGPLLVMAAEHRADLGGARERLAAVEVLREAAENALLPDLQLIFAPSYSGLEAGADVGSFFSALVENVPGASATLSLNLSWPLRNQRAEAELARLDASVRQGELLVERIGKEIGADVPAALEAVRRNAQRVQKARVAVSLFERAVVNEEKKLRAGTSTLLDLISQRDRLTSAQQGVVSAQLALALALLDLRLSTGTLFEDEGEATAVLGLRFFTLPEIEPADKEEPR